MSPNRPMLFLTVPPQQLRAACVFGLPIGHLAYRMGPGGHLLRSGAPVGMRGGLIAIEDTACDGQGDAAGFCQEVARECAARGFDGIICLFRQNPTSFSCKVVEELGEWAARRNWPLFVPERYARFSGKAKVLLPSALSGGSLRQRILDAAGQYGADKLALYVQRCAEDFYLPSASGGGVPLTRDALQQRIRERAPSIFFSDELCAHYFTYMSRQSGAHFVLFDDAGSIRKKLALAKELGVPRAILPYEELDDLLPALLS